jgi:hypothetical protein
MAVKRNAAAPSSSENGNAPLCSYGIKRALKDVIDRTKKRT